MTQQEIDAISAWLARCGLDGVTEATLVTGFCERCVAAGIPISRALVLIDTLDPVYEGRGFRWRDDDAPEESVIAFAHDDVSIGRPNWSSSPFAVLADRGGGELRFRLCDGETGGFEAAEELRVAGQTDYVVFVQKFAPDGALGDMDAVSSRFTTARSGGFGDEALGHLRHLVPFLALALKSISLVRVCHSLAEAYLGRDAGRRVLEGRVTRGVSETIRAVVWFSDMKGFTTISDSVEQERLLPLLDDYADAVISAIRAEGGDVLKLIGDGVLAIFTGEAPRACSRALAAEADMRLRLAEVTRRRSAAGDPVTNINIGLHVGEVLFGNIGSRERLDFTVVGSAVNEVSRIVSLCRSVDRDNLFSADFVASLPEEERATLVSVGRYALRGVGRAGELFTRDPETRPA